MKKQIFVIGLDKFNLKKLQRLPGAEEYDFLPALEISEMRQVDSYDMEQLIQKCSERIDKHGSIDAIVSYYDFPGTTLLPVIAEKYGLPGPTLESVMKCENKYWSRLEQNKVIPEHIPVFKAFDPFKKEVFKELGLVFPCWIKPIKSFRSFLAYRINGEAQFYEYMEEVKKQIDYISEPFNYLMKKYQMPFEFAEMEEKCIAESQLSGHQCTVEGYVYDGQVVVYGIVDSIRDEDRSSFASYEYPSSLPQEIQFRMADVTRRVITQVELDNSPFNIEYFYNQTADKVYLLEINPRISQAHTDIFEKVHGISHHYIMLNLALGKKPGIMEFNGKFNKAANFMLRTFKSGRIKKAPTLDEIKILKHFISGLEIKLHVTNGMHLSELHGQDSYSFELANILLGGRDHRDLVKKYNRCLKGLTFDIEYDDPTLLH